MWILFEIRKIFEIQIIFIYILFFWTALETRCHNYLFYFFIPRWKHASIMICID